VNGGNHYQVLGVARDATDREIKAAWRAGAKRSHPDRNPDDPTAEDRFKRIGAAYEILSDTAKRAEPKPPPPPRPRRAAPPRPPPKPKATRPTGPAPIPSWARRHPETLKNLPPVRCVSCGVTIERGAVRCEECWDDYDEELSAAYEYIQGMMQLHAVEAAMRRSRRVCYRVDQGRLEREYGSFGYWSRYGVPRW
jgi:hypothetical protein